MLPRGTWAMLEHDTLQLAAGRIFFNLCCHASLSLRRLCLKRSKVYIALAVVHQERAGAALQWIPSTAEPQARRSASSLRRNRA